MDSESRLQQECNVWFWNNFKDQRGLLCYNLNNSKNKIDGARNKSFGLIAGRSDMVYYYNGKAYMIEFKTESGTQTPKQRKWELLITKFSFTYIIIRSVTQFKEFILKINYC